MSDNILNKTAHKLFFLQLELMLLVEVQREKPQSGQDDVPQVWCVTASSASRRTPPLDKRISE